jgi:hypothetical protein
LRNCRIYFKYYDEDFSKVGALEQNSEVLIVISSEFSETLPEINGNPHSFLIGSICPLLYSIGCEYVLPLQSFDFCP